MQRLKVESQEDDDDGEGKVVVRFTMDDREGKEVRF